MVPVLIGMTMLSLAVAVVATFVAVRATREARRHSEARIETLARDLASEPALPGGDIGDIGDVGFRGMFTQVQNGRSAMQAPLSVVAGAILVSAVLGLVFVVSRGVPSAFSSSNGLAELPSRAIIPLELVALGHERRSGTLTIRGVVKNPTHGQEMNTLTATVLLLDADAQVVNSGRAAVHDQALRPDDQSTFLVTLPDGPDVAKYRVGFQTAQGTVPHIDRRDER
jgi:hypothetical protein